MAVTKLWSVTERLGQVIDYATNPEKTSVNIKREFSPEQYQALADVIAYAKDEEKTEREFYVEGINCNVAIARDQFITVKEQYQKTDGIQAYHGYLSFKETDISPEMAQKIGMEFANEVWGKRFQVVVTTHLNTKHLHCHFVINSISFVDGKHLWGEEKAWFKFRKVADRICEKYGLYYDPNPNRSKQSDYLTMKEKAGMPTRYSVAKEAIDYAIDHSKTLKEFQFALKEMGYAYNLSPSRKYWTVIPKGYDKPIRLKNLGADYTNDRIVERIKENRDRWAEIEPFQRATYKPRQYRMQTRGQKLKKKGGLYGLYGIEELFETGKHISVDIFSDEYMDKINAIQLPNTKIKILQRLLSQAIDEFKKVNKIMGVEFADRLKKVVDEYNNRRRDEAYANEVLDDVAEQLAQLLSELKTEKNSFKNMGIDYEEKAFYDILKAVSKKFEFEYPDDKMIELSKRIKLIVDDKSRYTDWSARDDIKANLQVDLILLLDEFGYPPVTIDDVYKEVLEQAENFKKYAQ